MADAERLCVVTGATGHVGGQLAHRLLAEGMRVRAVSRSEERLRPLVMKGAEPFVGSVDVAEDMVRAFAKADSLFLMIPPNWRSDAPFAFQQRVADAYMVGIRNIGVSHAVTLSSIGAHLPDGVGPILGLRYMEQTLDSMPDLEAVHLRAAYFMENLYGSLSTIRNVGILAAPLRADLSLPMIATRDVARVAAELLLGAEFRGKTIRELLGQRDVTMLEVTSAIGAAIGKPELQYMQAPPETAASVLRDSGATAEAIRILGEMAAAYNSGYIRPTETRSPFNTTPTSIEEFAASDFLRAYVTLQEKAA